MFILHLLIYLTQWSKEFCKYFLTSYMLIIIHLKFAYSILSYILAIFLHRWSQSYLLILNIAELRQFIWTCCICARLKGRRKKQSLQQGANPPSGEVFGDLNSSPHFPPLCQVRKQMNTANLIWAVCCGDKHLQTFENLQCGIVHG